MKKFFVWALLLMIMQSNYAQSGYKITNTFHIAGNGWWDYLAVHGNKLYVSHGSQVNILDKNTGDSLGIIKGTNGVHGIAFDEAQGKGYTSNGQLNNVFVFDIETGKIIDSIATGKNPDAIMYEPYIKKIITCNGQSNDLTVIDPLAGKTVNTILLPGKPETAISNHTGKLFVNIEDKNEIAVVDLQKMKVEKTFSLQNGEEPTGLAYDYETKKLFAGCDKLLVVIDAVSGNVIDKIIIGEGCDGVAFDYSTKTIFTANGASGTMTVIKEQSAGKFSVVENVSTKQGARTITIDESTHTLYLPTADFSKSKTANQRPAIIPGSSQVLVVTR